MEFILSLVRFKLNATFDINDDSINVCFGGPELDDRPSYKGSGEFPVRVKDMSENYKYNKV